MFRALWFAIVFLASSVGFSAPPDPNTMAAAVQSAAQTALSQDTFSERLITLKTLKSDITNMHKKNVGPNRSPRARRIWYSLQPVFKIETLEDCAAARHDVQYDDMGEMDDTPLTQRALKLLKAICD